MSKADSSTVMELNVGGVVYSTTLGTLSSERNSNLAQIASASTGEILKDSQGRLFIDRDGLLFRYVLDFLRNKRIILPESFNERNRLLQEAHYYGLNGLVNHLVRGKQRLDSSSDGKGIIDESVNDDIRGTSGGLAVLDLDGSKGEAGYVVVGYRGTFAFGRDGMADVKFRKLSRILVSGRVSICREVFGDTLNESRDPDRGTATDRYSARFFLKHTFIEQAFDALQEAGFRMVGSAGSGTNSAGESKPGMDSEENKWNHYNEFVFCRP